MNTYTAIILLSLLVVISCRPRQSEALIEEPTIPQPTVPISILDAEYNESLGEVILSFQEQMVYDSELLEVQILFYDSSGESVQFNDMIPDTRWLTEGMGLLGSGTSLLGITNLSDFSTLTVNLNYDTTRIDSKIFDFHAEKPK